MCKGERPMGAAKGKQSDTEALCQTPPSDPDFIAGKNEIFTNENIDLAVFGTQTFGLLGSRTPPPLFKENSGSVPERSSRGLAGSQVMRSDGTAPLGPLDSPHRSLRSCGPRQSRPGLLFTTRHRGCAGVGGARTPPTSPGTPPHRLKRLGPIFFRAFGPSKVVSGAFAAF